MARTKASLGAGARLADYIAVGYLALNCPLERVRETLSRCGAQSKRRRDLPHEVLVYYVMCLCLYRRAAYEEVFALVVEGLRGVYKDQIGAKLVSKGAISIARRQMGSAVFESLYREQVRPLGSWMRKSIARAPCRAYSGAGFAPWRSTAARLI